METITPLNDEAQGFVYCGCFDKAEIIDIVS